MKELKQRATKRQMCLNQVKGADQAGNGDWISRVLWITVKDYGFSSNGKSLQSLRRMTLDLYFKLIILASLLRLWTQGKRKSKDIKQGKNILIIYYTIINYITFQCFIYF